MNLGPKKLRDYRVVLENDLGERRTATVRAPSAIAAKRGARETWPTLAVVEATRA